MVYMFKRDFKEYPYWKKGTMFLFKDNEGEIWEMKDKKTTNDYPLRPATFLFEDDEGEIWGMKDKKTTNDYPLRPALANYLWLIRNEKGLLSKVKID